MWGVSRWASTPAHQKSPIKDNERRGEGVCDTSCPVGFLSPITLIRRAAIGAAGRHSARRIWGWETRTVRHQSYSFTVRNRCALVRSSAPVRQRLSRGNRGRRLARRKEYWALADGSAAPRAPPPPVAAPPARRLHNRSSQRRGSVARRLRPGTGGGEGGGQPTRGDRGRRVACSQAQVEGRWGSC